jgi:hypothetical protein
MNLNQQQARNAGIALIVLGVVAVFSLWGLIPLALLAGGGYAIYRRQHALGRQNEAVQALLWGVGLAVLMVLDLLWPGVLLLGGASLLLRGHEAQAEQRVAGLIGQVTRRRAPAASPTPTQVTIVGDEPANTTQTVRLR